MSSSPHNTQDLFERLCGTLNAQPDRRGEAHVDCPLCGKEAKRGQTHFSFGTNGGHCFCCGQSIGLVEMARQMGLLDGTPAVPYRPVVVPKPKPKPQHRAQDWERIVGGYERHPQRFEVWARYKPLPREIVEGYRLGVGAFPAYTSQCQHERLMVPLICEGRVVSLRGRVIAGGGCERADPPHAKWLSPVGFSPVLFNGEHLAIGPTFCRVLRRFDLHSVPLVIVENPIDALMCEWRRGVPAVATLGVTNWLDEWTEALVAARPLAVIIAYDNDRPGNGGGVRGRAAWLEKHSRDIEPNGVKLANRLLKAGIRGYLLDWRDAPLKADVGDLLAKEKRDAEDGS